MDLQLRGDAFVELGRICGWQPETVVVVMYGYFDETYDHPLTSMTVGGCIASFESWSAFSEKWKKALGDEGISCFHMTDFESYQGAFARWHDKDGNRDIERHKNFLTLLLDILTAHVTRFVGFSNEPISGPRPIRDTYHKCVSDVMMYGVQQGATSSDERFSFMFAHHPEYAEAHVLDLQSAMNFDKRVRTVSVGYPEGHYPLQAADLVAFELRKISEGHERRYPFRRLLAVSEELRLISRAASVPTLRRQDERP